MSSFRIGPSWAVVRQLRRDRDLLPSVDDDRSPTPPHRGDAFVPWAGRSARQLTQPLADQARPRAALFGAFAIISWGDRYLIVLVPGLTAQGPQ